MLADINLFSPAKAPNLESFAIL